jgi:hypothetical protein
MKKDWLTLEQALDEAFAQGKEKDFVSLLRLMPPHKQEKYRELWKQKKEEYAKKERVCEHGVAQTHRCWDCDPQ